MVATGNKKTFSSYLGDKVALRVNNLPKGKEINVLDCYAGKGTIWRAVRLLTGREINVLPIDTTNSDGFFMPGDNLSFLKIIDLSRFQVVDLDAYGIPYEQLKILFDREYKGTVFVTFIQSQYGMMNQDMLVDLRFTAEMVKTIPTLFAKSGWSYFCEWLALNGVSKIRVRQHQRKHYLYFRIG